MEVGVGEVAEGGGEGEGAGCFGADVDEVAPLG